ncbi:MAG: hypothetical protein J2P15_17665, partial [Micromonosporaceae bacterium]|nr:hypothetical protein [Micromonosporaceae bacterium]
GLSGCRLDNGSAAYVGDTRYTESRIDGIVAAYKKDGARLTDERGTRQSIVTELMFLTLARRYAQERHLQIPASDYAPLADQTGLPASDPYLRIHVDAQTYSQGLIRQASPGPAVTEAQYREIYQRLVAQGVQQDYPSIKAFLQQNPVGPALAVRDQLAAAGKRYGLDVNPKYGALEYPLAQVSTSAGEIFTLVSIPLGQAGTPAVVDLPTPMAGAQ